MTLAFFQFIIPTAVYARICCLTRGSIIRHFLCDTSESTHLFRSLIMHLDRGSTPANLYFHILYFIYIFISIYNTVASFVPSSFPIRKSPLSTVTLFPQKDPYTSCMHLFTVLQSQKICGLSSSTATIPSFSAIPTFPLSA